MLGDEGMWGGVDGLWSFVVCDLGYEMGGLMGDNW